MLILQEPSASLALVGSGGAAGNGEVSQRLISGGSASRCILGVHTSIFQALHYQGC